VLVEPPLVVDTDFLSSFAWVDRLDILETLYLKKIVLLEEVAIEIGRVPHLWTRVEICVSKGTMIRVEMSVDSPEALDLAKYLEDGKYGRGEAACMAYLKHNSGTLGSNNLADVTQFCQDNNKRLLCTGHCLCQALISKLVSFNECESLWQQMLKKRRKLPTSTFKKFITDFGIEI